MFIEIYMYVYREKLKIENVKIQKKMVGLYKVQLH